MSDFVSNITKTQKLIYFSNVLISDSDVVVLANIIQLLLFVITNI